MTCCIIIFIFEKNKAAPKLLNKYKVFPYVFLEKNPFLDHYK